MLSFDKYLAVQGGPPPFLDAERFVKEFPTFTYRSVVRETPKDIETEILKTDAFDLMFNSSGGNTTGYWSPQNSSSYIREDRTLPMVVTALHEYAHSQSQLDRKNQFYENEAEIFEMLGVRLLQRTVDPKRQEKLGIENIPGELEESWFGDKEFEKLRLMYLAFREP